MFYDGELFRIGQETFVNEIGKRSENADHKYFDSFIFLMSRDNEL